MRNLVLKLECRHDDLVYANRVLSKLDHDRRRSILARQTDRTLFDLTKVGRSNPWVAEIVGLDRRGQFQRRFVQGMKTYEESNSKGSRGVFMFFVLQRGVLYEIFDRPKHLKSRRRFAVADDGGMREVNIEDALKWASRNRSTSTF